MLSIAISKLCKEILYKEGHTYYQFCLGTKFECSKAILIELVGRKYVRCFIAVPNFKKFDWVQAHQNVVRTYIFLNKNP